MASGADSLPQLTNEEIKRYSRHLIMPEVGMDGQRRLKAGSVLCIGAGGLGSPAAMYLAAAGVGRIGLVDYDVVDYSNLQRQIIHGTPDVGRSKLASAKGSSVALPWVTSSPRSRATLSIPSERSSPWAERATAARRCKMSPVPQPTSSTRRPRAKGSAIDTSRSSIMAWYPRARSRSYHPLNSS